MPIDSNDPYLNSLYNQMNPLAGLANPNAAPLPGGPIRIMGPTGFMTATTGPSAPPAPPPPAPPPSGFSVAPGAPAGKGSVLAPGMGFDDLRAGKLAPPPPEKPEVKAAPKAVFAAPQNGPGAPGADAPLLTNVNLPKARTYTSEAHEEDIAGPETRRLLDRSNAAQREAGEAQLGADLSRSIGKAQTSEDLAKLLNAHADKQTKEEIQRQATLDDYMQKQQQLSDDVRNARVDPGHYFQSRSVMGNIMGVLAAGIGGYIAGSKGGENEYLKHLDNAISRDIAAQQDAIANKKTALAEGKNLFAQKMQQFGDARTAAAAAKGDMLAAIQAKGEQLAASADTEQARANWAKFNASIEQQIAAQHAQLYKWQPKQSVTVGGVDEAAITKRAMALRDKASENGVNMTPDQARAQAKAEMGYGQYQGPGYAKVDKDAAAAGPQGDPFAGLYEPKSTAWRPWRKWDGNEAHDNLLKQQATNVATATALGGGKLTPRSWAAAEKAGLLIEGGDDQDEINTKKAMVRQLAARGGIKPSAAKDDVADLVEMDE